ncbi:hypothetical protein SAZ11_59140 [Streptomyces sp. FXJ1.4098]|nr:hypothetical protein [Streptomyces sp. FXJ1.4098]
MFLDHEGAVRADAEPGHGAVGVGGRVAPVEHLRQGDGGGPAARQRKRDSEHGVLVPALTGIAPRHVHAQQAPYEREGDLDREAADLAAHRQPFCRPADLGLVRAGQGDVPGAAGGHGQHAAQGGGEAQGAADRSGPVRRLVPEGDPRRALLRGELQALVTARDPEHRRLPLTDNRHCAHGC